MSSSMKSDQAYQSVTRRFRFTTSDRMVPEMIAWSNVLHSELFGDQLPLEKIPSGLDSDHLACSCIHLLQVLPQIWPSIRPLLLASSRRAFFLYYCVQLKSPIITSIIRILISHSLNGRMHRLGLRYTPVIRLLTEIQSVDMLIGPRVLRLTSSQI